MMTKHSSIAILAVSVTLLLLISTIGIMNDSAKINAQPVLNQTTVARQITNPVQTTKTVSNNPLSKQKVTDLELEIEGNTIQSPFIDTQYSGYPAYYGVIKKSSGNLHNIYWVFPPNSQIQQFYNDTISNFKQDGYKTTKTVENGWVGQKTSDSKSLMVGVSYSTAYGSVKIDSGETKSSTPAFEISPAIAVFSLVGAFLLLLKRKI